MPKKQQITKTLDDRIASGEIIENQILRAVRQGDVLPQIRPVEILDEGQVSKGRSYKLFRELLGDLRQLFILRCF